MESKQQQEQGSMERLPKNGSMQRDARVGSPILPEGINRPRLFVRTSLLPLTTSRMRHRTPEGLAPLVAGPSPVCRPQPPLGHFTVNAIYLSYTFI